MSELIIVKPDKCVGCNACIRACPAPEANTAKMLDGGKFVTSVNPERCVGCGECVKNCNCKVIFFAIFSVQVTFAASFF